MRDHGAHRLRGDGAKTHLHEAGDAGRGAGRLRAHADRAGDGVGQENAVAAGQEELRGKHRFRTAKGKSVASTIASAAPKICKPTPARIMLSTPKRGDSRAAIRLPIM